MVDVADMELTMTRYQPCHVIGNLVRQRRRMLHCQWGSLLCVALISTVVIICCWEYPFVDRRVYNVESGYPVVREPRCLAGAPRQVAPEFVNMQLSSGSMTLARFGPVTIVPSGEGASFAVQSHRDDGEFYAPCLKEIMPTPEPLTYDSGDDFGLPPVRALWRYTESVETYKENSPARGMYPDIIVEEGATTFTSRSLSEGAYVAGWLYYQINGLFRFEPLPEVSFGVPYPAYEYLAGAVVDAYAKTPCVPAVEEGVVITVRVRLNVYFNEGPAGDLRIPDLTL